MSLASTYDKVHTWCDQDDAADAPAAMVLLHGFMGNAASWREVVADLTWNRTILAPHLPGHHVDSPLQAQGTFEAHAQSLAEAIAESIDRPAHFVGYSMGGRLALGIAATQPQLVRSLTLIGTHPGLSATGERQERDLHEREWAAILRHEGMSAFVDYWDELPLFASQKQLPSARTQSQRENRLTHEPEQLARCIEQLGLSRMPCYAKSLMHLSMPVQLVVGSKDRKFRDLAGEMLDPLRHGRLHHVPSGHNPLLECPTALAQMLEEFVGEADQKDSAASVA